MIWTLSELTMQLNAALLALFLLTTPTFADSATAPDVQITYTGAAAFTTLCAQTSSAVCFCSRNA